MEDNEDREPVDINRYLVNPFDDDKVQNGDNNIQVLSNAQKKSLVDRLHGFKNSHGTEAATRQGYSTDDAPQRTENGITQKIFILPSHTYPFSNTTMRDKVTNYWRLVGEALTRSWLNAILNPPAVVAQVVTGAATKHEVARILHLFHDPANAVIYGMINEPLNRQGLDRQRTEAGEMDNGYVRFIHLFNDPNISYEHPIDGDGTNAHDAKYVVLYPYVKDIYCNHEEANRDGETNIKLRDAAWLKTTWTHVKGKLTTVMTNWTRSGTYSTEDSEWIASAEHARSLTSFHGGIDWILYAFAFIDQLQMDTYNKVIPNGLENGNRPGNPPVGGSAPRTRTPSGSDIDLTEFVEVEQQRLQYQRTNDGQRNQIEAAGRLANLNPLNEEETLLRSEGIRYLASFIRPPLPPPPPPELITPTNNNNNRNRRRR